MSVLKVGMQSPEVVEVKRLLARQGHWPASNVTPNFTPTLEQAVIYFQQTHLGEHGRPCGVDGKVGPETMWALRHASGEPQRSHIDPESIPSGIGDERRRLLEIAVGEHGVREIPNGSNRSSTPRGGIDKYLPAWAKENETGPAWCCFFVSWVTKEAFGTYPLGRREGACRNAKALAQANGTWRAKSGYAPVPGDAFVMLYPKKGNAPQQGHIGLVLRVSEDGQAFNTVEGNTGNRVKIGRRDVAESTLMGFIDFCGDGRTRDGFERGLASAEDSTGDTTR